jgi:haloacid dehalogenase superfamily, subfamily IA, variant 3 with third motif having DD or ED/haloacid dehalogenase superfamily, subfamily IA, variant 1 with third motif having Dx(3-4)D or Dx(3-4)E
MTDEPLRAFLFDLDGTLINSREIDRLTFKQVMWDYLHLDVGDAGFNQYRGTPVPKIMLEFVPADKVPEMLEAWIVYKTRNGNEMFLYPGIASLIEELKQAGIKVAVVTSQSENESALTRKCLNLDGVFDAWVTSDQVSRPKPDAEPVLTALQQLNVPPTQAIMIGDTFNDLEAGQNAGTRIGAVMWGFGDPDNLLAHHPDYVFRDVKDIRALIQRASQN